MALTGGPGGLHGPRSQGCTGSDFLLWGVTGRGREIIFLGVGRGEAGAKSSGQGGATVKLGAGQGSLEFFWGWGSPGQVFFPGPGQGGAGRASLLEATPNSWPSRLMIMRNVCKGLDQL